MNNEKPNGRIGVLVAARTGSTRLPGKALLPLGGVPMICFLLNRLKNSKVADKIMLATTTLAGDDELADVVGASGLDVFRGSPENLIQRYVDAGTEQGFDTLVRVTGDCPFVDAETLDFCLRQCADAPGFDIATTKGRFPVGIDYEIFPLPRMIDVLRQPDLSDDDREHLTLHMYNHPDEFTVLGIDPRIEWSPCGRDLTVDTEDDYRDACALVDALGCNDFSVKDLIVTACP